MSVENQQRKEEGSRICRKYVGGSYIRVLWWIHPFEAFRPCVESCNHYDRSWSCQLVDLRRKELGFLHVLCKVRLVLFWFWRSVDRLVPAPQSTPAITDFAGTAACWYGHCEVRFELVSLIELKGGAIQPELEHRWASRWAPSSTTRATQQSTHDVVSVRISTGAGRRTYLYAYSVPTSRTQRSGDIVVHTFWRMRVLVYASDVAALLRSGAHVVRECSDSPSPVNCRLELEGRFFLGYHNKQAVSPYHDATSEWSHTRRCSEKRVTSRGHNSRGSLSPRSNGLIARMLHIWT